MVTYFTIPISVVRSQKKAEYLKPAILHASDEGEVIICLTDSECSRDDSPFAYKTLMKSRSYQLLKHAFSPVAFSKEYTVDNQVTQVRLNIFISSGFLDNRGYFMEGGIAY
ncbi:hypothetical protein ACTXT7_010908 [Hymenolepis weldensis]